LPKELTILEKLKLKKLKSKEKRIFFFRLFLLFRGGIEKKKITNFKDGLNKKIHSYFVSQDNSTEISFIGDIRDIISTVDTLFVVSFVARANQKLKTELPSRIKKRIE